jgi:hypothetical protein
LNFFSIRFSFRSDIVANVFVYGLLRVSSN